MKKLLTMISAFALTTPIATLPISCEKQPYNEKVDDNKDSDQNKQPPIIDKTPQEEEMWKFYDDTLLIILNTDIHTQHLTIHYVFGTVSAYDTWVAKLDIYDHNKQYFINKESKNKMQFLTALAKIFNELEKN